MTINEHYGANGKNGLVGTELPPDGLDLVQHLQDHLRRNPDDVQTWQALQMLQPATSVEPLPRWRWSESPDPPPRLWLLDNWLPAGRLTLLCGPGGAGKSRLALQLAAGIASGGGEGDTWIDAPIDILRLGKTVPKTGYPVVYATWEDEPEEFGRRLSQISGRQHSQKYGSAAEWVTPERLDNLEVINLAKRGPLWAPLPGSRHLSALAGLTETGQLLRTRCVEVGAKLLVLDPLAAVYLGDENSRGLVRAFASDWDGWAIENHCAILIVAHPPKSRSDYSGSTDWEAAFRARWTMEKERRGTLPTGKGNKDDRPEVWQLSLPKRNYGPEQPPLALDLDLTGGMRWRAEWWDEES